MSAPEDASARARLVAVAPLPPQAGFPPSPKPGRDLRQKVLRMALRVSVGLVILALVGRLLGRDQMGRGIALARHAGWPLALVLLGTPLSLAGDALGWRAVLQRLGYSVRWWPLARIRLFAESAALALPGGSIFAEAAKLSLLRHREAVPTSTAVASLALVRALHTTGAAAYFTMVACLAFTVPPNAALRHRHLVVAMVVAASLLTGIGSRLLAWGLRDSQLAARFARRAERLPWRRVADWARRNDARLREIDSHTARYFSASRRWRLRSTLPFVAQWLVEGAETVLILTLLDAGVGIRGALIVDALTSFSRAVVVFVPAGLGVQEALQIFLLQALGARDGGATVVAFIFIKRTKELFWIVAGALSAAATKNLWQATRRTVE